MSKTKKTDPLSRYTAALHAMQSGVRMLMNYDPPEVESSETSPKHLRVGVNAAMSDQGALARLLIGKGLISEEEYLEAIATGMEQEQASYEERLRERFGHKGITLA